MENTDNFYEDVFSEYYKNLLNILDGKIRTEDGFQLGIHRYVLVMNSQYFYTIFCGLNTDKRDVLVPGIAGNIMKNILLYIYTGKVTVSPEEVGDLLMASDYLLMDDLLTKIVDYAKNNIAVRNCLSVYTASLHINQRDLIQPCFRFIQINFERIVCNEDSRIEEVPLHGLKRVLGDNNLYVRCEKSVWKALAKWVESDLSLRQIYVPELLACLKVADVSEDLASEILTHNIVARNPFYKCINKKIAAKDYNISNVEVMAKFLQSQRSSDPELHRLPSQVHFILQDQEEIRKMDNGIYVTYDENLDLWRKITKTNIFPKFLVPVRDSIYMFNYENNDRTYVLNRFNLIERRWVQIRSPRRPRYIDSVVGHKGLIYMIGCQSLSNDNDKCDVVAYNPLLDTWSEHESMIFTTHFCAVSFGGKIYVIGYNLEEEDVPGGEGQQMLMQVYDAESNTWTLCPPPIRYHNTFQLITCRDKLYLIGQTESTHKAVVEQFEPESNDWRILSDLPSTYACALAINLNNRLIIYEADPVLRNLNKLPEPIPSVRWNDELEEWEAFQESSTLKGLHKYFFAANTDKDSLMIITTQNRDLISHFERSPFN